jgi:3-hydroxybutyryl-CoA dehydrogenase
MSTTSATTCAVVGVVGCGTMGSGIAQVVAQSGRSAIVLEADAGLLERGLARIRAFLSGGVERGKLTAADRDDVLSRIQGTTAIDDLAGVDLVIEAATEDPAVKRELLDAVSRVVAADAIVTTNTSALSITELASAVSHPARFAGLHFFNPAPLMPLVEVVAALQTDRTVVDTLVALCEQLGKEPVTTDDRPGFIVNRILLPFLNDVIQAYDDRLATAEDIDVALELGLGHKLGPLRLLDLIGLDVHLHATASAYAQTLDPAYAPPPLLARMVQAGHLGKKTGTGFRTVERR